MSNLIMMMGCPGVGKSTFVKEHCPEHIDAYVSRDDIRFSIVREDKEYFSHETEVWNIFVATIARGLKFGGTVWADATHLNMKSRLKLLNALPQKPDNIEIIFLDAPLETALEQNELRKGTRAYVPPEQVKRMWFQVEEPEFHEGKYTYNKIYIVRPGEPIIIKEEQ